jgi:hypothetical protein
MAGMSMERLALRIEIAGRILRQVKRGKRCALYAVSNRAGTLYGHEVIKIKRLEPKVIIGIAYGLREGYPSNKEWGTLAWSFGTQQTDVAERAFAYLLKQENFRQR